MCAYVCVYVLTEGRIVKETPGTASCLETGACSRSLKDGSAGSRGVGIQSQGFPNVMQYCII